MFCDLNYRQDEGALEGPEKEGETIFQTDRGKNVKKNRQYAYIQ